MKKVGLIAALGLIGLYWLKNRQASGNSTTNSSSGSDNSDVNEIIDDIPDTSMPNGVQFKARIEFDIPQEMYLISKLKPDVEFEVPARTIVAWNMTNSAPKDIALYKLSVNSIIYGQGMYMPSYSYILYPILLLKDGWYQHEFLWGHVKLKGSQILEIWNYLKNDTKDDPQTWALTVIKWEYAKRENGENVKRPDGEWYESYLGGYDEVQKKYVGLASRVRAGEKE